MKTVEEMKITPMRLIEGTVYENLKWFINSVGKDLLLDAIEEICPTQAAPDAGGQQPQVDETEPPAQVS